MRYALCAMRFSELGEVKWQNEIQSI